MVLLRFFLSNDNYMKDELYIPFSESPGALSPEVISAFNEATLFQYNLLGIREGTIHYFAICIAMHMSRYIPRYRSHSLWNGTTIVNIRLFIVTMT